MMRRVFLLLPLLFSLSSVYAQFEIDAEIRPRLEFRNGYKQPLIESAESASFIDQRTRLNFGYNHELVNLYISFQDVRVWGSTKQLAEDSNSLSLHQAYADIKFDSEWLLRLGRQELSYDDQRLFGAVGWAQQARSHDMALLRYKNSSDISLDFAFAYNQDGASLSGNEYETSGSYKNLQHVRFHKKSSNIQYSLILLNIGQQYPDLSVKDKVYYQQTFGGHFNKYKGDFTLTVNLFASFGKDNTGRTLSAQMIGAEGKYKLGTSGGLVLGAEYQSGTDLDGSDTKNRSFNPYFGTNHKFNGYMDYFYVGNHINSVGLIDLYLGGTYSKDRWFVGGTIHTFNAPADLTSENVYDPSSHLGSELDLTVKYKQSKFVLFQGGYSQMFTSDSMKLIKGVDSTSSQNWAYLMVTVKPILFKSKR